MILFIGIQFSLENLLYSLYSMLKHHDEIFNCLLNWLFKVKWKDCHLELLIGTCWVNKYLFDVFDQLIESWLITDSCKHRKELKFDSLAESIKFNCHGGVSTYNNFLFITFDLRMNFIVKSWQFMDLFDSLVDNHKTKLIVLNIEHFIVI